MKLVFFFRTLLEFVGKKKKKFDSSVLYLYVASLAHFSV